MNKPTSTQDADEDSRPVAKSKYKSRRLNGAIGVFLGLFMIFIFNSAIDKAGTDPSAGLIVVIFAPLIVLGAIAVVVGIVMLLFSSGSNDSASMEQNNETRDSDNESPEKGGKPDHKSVDYSARDFVKETASKAAGELVVGVVIVALLLFLTSAFLGSR